MWNWSEAKVPMMIVASGLLIAGCGAASGGWAALFGVLFWVAALGLSGCTESHRMGGDAGEDSGVVEGDGGDGTWDRCCNGEGVIDTCFCPAGVACNYGWFTDCGDGTCVGAGLSCSGEDAGTDAGGTWDPCCNDGVIDTCYCPAGVACNYGWFTDCGGGTCSWDDSCDVDGGGPSVDAGVGVDAGVDAGEPGEWEPCCVEGVIDSCFCPAGAICNYGWYTDCGDGLCAFGGDACLAES